MKITEQQFLVMFDTLLQSLSSLPQFNYPSEIRRKTASEILNQQTGTMETQEEEFCKCFYNFKAYNCVDECLWKRKIIPKNHTCTISTNWKKCKYGKLYKQKKKETTNAKKT